jgi:hypothetical protein
MIGHTEKCAHGSFTELEEMAALDRAKTTFFTSKVLASNMKNELN